MKINTLRHHSSLDILFDSLPPDNNGKGKQFERVAKWYLEMSPEYGGRFENVWLWNDWPGRRTRDIGIDLVAETEDGELWAIQAKGYNPGNLIPTSDIDSFISASSTGDFTHRLLITTGNVTKIAETKLKQQAIPSPRLLYQDLLSSSVDWQAFQNPALPARLERKTPRPYQQQAIDDVLAGFANSDKGCVIMACGTGKTLVGLWVDEAAGNMRTLVLVPSLSLIKQISREWYNTSNEPFQALFVCSDQSARDERFISDTGQLGHPVTVDPAEIERFLSGHGRRVIFCTYQSSPQIVAAQRQGASAFDLVIADEAHHCSGKVDSAFATVLDPESLKGTHRLFMTATPRYMSGRIKDTANQSDIQITSMDDESIFGPEFYVLKFGEAIKQGYLSDYQVVVMGVTNREVKRLAENRVLVQLLGATHETDAQSLAAILGTLMAIQKYDLHHVITFHNRVQRAKDFSKEVKDTNDALQAESSNKSLPALFSLWTRHVSGEMNAGDRDLVMREFKQNTEGTRLLSNARCLGEGVDIKEIDGIGFIDPRRSHIDIIQAVGRAIRKSDSEKIGTVVIPVLIDDESGVDWEEQLNQSRFEPIWGVLNALKAHDDELAEQLDELRFQLGKHRRVVGALPTKIVLGIPTSVGIDFVRAIETRIIETTTSSWEFMYGLLSAYVEREGHARAAAKHLEGDYRLGRWISYQRTNKDRLSPEQLSRLESLPGWTWNTLEADWEDGYAALKKFIAREGHARVPIRYVDGAFALGRWINHQRTRTDLLTSERISRLESLPGWVWNANKAAWEDGFAALKKYVEREGNALLPNTHIEDNYRLGRWVSHQRSQPERLSPVQVSRLKSFPGWEWNVLDATWENGFAALGKFVDREGHARVPGSHLEGGFRLGQWVTSQRSRKDRSSPEQISRLESQPGWAWNSLEASWEDGFVALKKYVAREGHAVVPGTHTEDGFKLGSWVSTQRSLRDRYTHQRISRLEGLPGWVWGVRESGWREAAWEVGFAALKRFSEREMHVRVPGSHIEDGLKLGAWLIRQRSRREGLSQEQISRLEGMTGWTWNTLEAAWEDGFAVLEKFMLREGHALVPQSHIEDGYRLGRWVINLRARPNRLSSDQKSRLEALPGWAWNTHEAAWEVGFAALKKFVAREGHSRVPESYVEEAYKLGQWVRVQMATRATEGLPPERISRLESLAGWVWSRNETAWEEGFTVLKKYVEREGHARVPYNHKEDEHKLGPWVGVQRRNRGSLSTARISRLESLTGWTWNAN